MFSAVVMLIFVLRTVFLEHMCASLSVGVGGAYGVFSVVDLLLVDGVHGAYGVLSAVVMLILYLQTVFVEHMVCSQLS